MDLSWLRTARRSLSSDKVQMVLGALYLLALVNLSFWLRGWTDFQFAYYPVALLFILLAFGMYGSKLYERFSNLSLVWKMGVVFVLAIAMRAIFLPHYPILSEDIWRTTTRAKLLLEGNVPYRDFDVNKPPLYIYVLGAIGYIFGVGHLQYRIVFTVLDAAVAALMLLIPRAMRFEHANVKGYWVLGALLYSICPVPILEVGLAGHYDPVTVLVVTIALIALFYQRGLTSGLFLGAGFVLKLYPLFLLPVFFLHLRTKGKRALFIIGFIIVPFISSIPTLLVDPSLLPEYLKDQTVGWYHNPSIQGALSYFLEGYIPTSVFNVVFLLLFFGLAGMLLLSLGAKKHLGKMWMRIALFGFLLQIFVLFGFMVGMYFIPYTKVLVPFAAVALSVDMLLIIFIVYMVRNSLKNYDDSYPTPAPLARPKGKNILIALFDPIPPDAVITSSLCILMLLILTSSQFHPWYLLWLFPLVVSIRDRNLMLVFFFMFVILTPMAYGTYEFNYLIYGHLAP